MSDPYFQQLFADRIGGANYGKGTEIYKFEKIKRAKRKALAEHPERKLVDFGMGAKPARATLAAALITPGDVTLMTAPGYPVAGPHTRYYGGEPHRLPLLAE